MALNRALAAVGRADCADCPPDRPGARVITVDRKVIEVGGKMYLEVPKSCKQRRTIYTHTTPAGYPLAERLGPRRVGPR